MADTETTNILEEQDMDSHKARRHSEIRVFSGTAPPTAVDVTPDEVLACAPIGSSLNRSVRSDLAARILAGPTHLLDMSRRSERRHCFAATLQLPALRARRLPGEVAAAVCGVQVALRLVNTSMLSTC